MKQLFAILLTVVISTVSSWAATITITGNITANKTFFRTNVYVLSPGFHYVTNNAILSVQSGTVIKGDGGALVITRGAKLNAVGTLTAPIVFTSNKPAGIRAAQDWGGIIICGNAPINDPAGQRVAEGGIDPILGLYGGTNPTDNSGSLKYVRIEYAGIPYLANNETNGLTLAGVGSGTIIDHVQVSMGGDDSFEWFGGTVNAKYLVANRGLDDDFDTDWGYSGKIQFAVAVRDPQMADISGSNGFESDNDATGTTNGPKTNPTFSNVSSFGPIQQVGMTVNTNYKRGTHIRRNSEMDLRNSVVTGWPFFTRIEGTNAGSYITGGSLLLANNLYAGCTTTIETGSVPEATAAWLTTNNNTGLTNPTDVQYVNPYNTSLPNFNPQTTSPVLAGASFAGMTGFTATTYVGAFAKTTYGRGDWTDCWTKFDPQNDPYTAAQNYAYTATLSSTAVTVGTPVVVNASGSSNYSYAWYKTTNAYSPIGTASTFTPTVAGNYKVLVSDVRGCNKLLSVSVTNTGLVQSPIANTIEEESINVYPNPSKGEFTVDFYLENEVENVSLILTDMLGRVISTKNIEGSEGTNRLSFNEKLNSGIYTLYIDAANQRIAKKVIVE